MPTFGQTTSRTPRPLLLTLLVALIVLLAPQAHAQGKLRSVHDDWQIRCDDAPGAKTEECSLFQSVAAEDRPNVGIVVIVLKSADQKARILRVRVPLTALLPPGLGLTIDNVNMGRIPYRNCQPGGCFAEVTMDDALLQKFLTGTTAMFLVYHTAQEAIAFPVSLKGFAQGYDKLP